METAYDRHCKELVAADEKLEKSYEDTSAFEAEVLAAEEAKILAVAQLDGLKEEVAYLRGQVAIYQQRLGLLPQESRSSAEMPKKPLRAARVPFAVAEARIQSQRTEEYWKKRAELADVGGVEAVTSTDTKEVS